ncbi:uncharacterized protein BO66DRAFT_121117 [Aspergillus aculeatinus CBS 121060]|uniref:Uncharacterized protein n=1 Tax=Aspergillus aculeatinus CBS 121060 TaxID=1448322 RepID=A0ACD1H5H7_9EURO|nr:hypothetical protein BO66DRAFT_121117 [Aspergillus aculeatinus CBS 121060]RAH68758.1 hypothetical protein BO66DRAFT_121117 [Aspergillus aculeatinus CBS 121060]
MSIIKRTIRFIKNLLRHFPRAGDEDELDSQREQVLSNLWTTYEVTRAMELDPILMDPEQLAKLDVLILPFDLTSDTDTDPNIPLALNPANYFVPLAYDYVREHPVNLSDSDTARWFNYQATALHPEFRGFTNRTMSSHGAADLLSRCLHIEMSSSRLNCEDGTQKLTWLNKWRVR